MNKEKTNVAVFASGTGSNAEKIIQYFSQNVTINIALIVSNKQDAGVITIAHNNKIPVLIIEKEQFFRGDAYTDYLMKASIDFIVLAGFLWKIPANLIHAYPNKIVNIHPSLLPKYGGKGMFGNNVHQAVIDNHETESGITIHYVNEEFDKGLPIFQIKCEVHANDDANSLAKRIHQLEHTYFSKVVEQVIIKETT
ncbi:MAG: phosphoribosylglycinamide formyltransferase [Chitinophagaceae bacterium]